jgi:hypothetical protein
MKAELNWENVTSIDYPQKVILLFPTFILKMKMMIKI